jgi:hypothetical protein
VNQITFLKIVGPSTATSFERTVLPAVRRHCRSRHTSRSTGFFPPRLNAVSLGFTAGAVVLLLLALSIIVVPPNILGSLGLQATTEWVFVIVRWPLLLAGIVLALAFIYRRARRTLNGTGSPSAAR